MKYRVLITWERLLAEGMGRWLFVLNFQHFARISRAKSN